MLWLAIVYTETVTYKLKQASCGWSRSDDDTYELLFRTRKVTTEKNGLKLLSKKTACLNLKTTGVFFHKMIS